MGNLILCAILLVSAQTLPQTATGTLTGRLTSIQGEPVAGLRVIALETSYPRMNIASQAETDRDGRYRLDNVREGEYFIVADPFKIPSYYPGTGNRDDSKHVSIIAGATINNVDFPTVRNSGILRTVRTPSQGATRYSGVIRDTSGNGLANTTVSLYNPSTDTRLWTITNASGFFEFSNLRAGAYSLETFSPGFKQNVGWGNNEELTETITLRANEDFHEEIGLRRFGNWEQRPDLYTPFPTKPRVSGVSASIGDVPFWRLQKLDQQVQPQYPQAARDANIKGSATVQIQLDRDGKLLWMRAASSDQNPELVRAVFEAITQWHFVPFAAQRRNEPTPDDPLPVQSTVTFNFPPE